MTNSHSSKKSIHEIKKRMFAGHKPFVYVFGDYAEQSWALRRILLDVVPTPQEALDNDLEEIVQLANNLYPILVVRWKHIFSRDSDADKVMSDLVLESGRVEPACVYHAFFASESDTIKLSQDFVDRYASRANQRCLVPLFANTFSYAATEGEILTELIIGIEHLPEKHLLA